MRLSSWDAATLAHAVASAKAVQPGWAAVNPQRRARAKFNFKALIETHLDELAHLLSSGHGKVISDARATFSGAWTSSNSPAAFRTC